MTRLINVVNTVACAFAVSTGAMSDALARRLQLNDTGITQCIDHQKQWSTQCTKSRQDAADGRDRDNANPDDGVAGFSFRKVCRTGQLAGEGSCPPDPILGSGPNDWGCTYDEVSELTWEVKTADGGVHDYLRRFTNRGGKASDDPRDAAWLKEATNIEILCGAANWRLPEVFELQGILNYGMGTPDAPDGSFVDSWFFPHMRGSFTWSRNELVHDPKFEWSVNFGTGLISAQQRFELAYAVLVHRANRQPKKGLGTVENRFRPSLDGEEVTDVLTGLVWRRCVAGMVWDIVLQRCQGEAERFGWRDAIDYARQNQDGGWRLPNIKELYSLVDLDSGSPAIDHTAFPNTPTFPPTMSSTPTSVQGLNYIYGVFFFRGSVEQSEAFGGDAWPVRLVRRGRI